MRVHINEARRQCKSAPFPHFAGAIAKTRANILDLACTNCHIRNDRRRTAAIEQLHVVKKKVALSHPVILKPTCSLGKDEHP